MKNLHLAIRRPGTNPVAPIRPARRGLHKESRQVLQCRRQLHWQRLGDEEFHIQRRSRRRCPNTSQDQ